MGQASSAGCNVENAKKQKINSIVLVLFVGCLLLGGRKTPLVADTLPVAPGGPFSRVYLPQNAPVGEDRFFGPSSWEQMNENPEHNAAFHQKAGGPSWFYDGVGWRFAEARAWPLEEKNPFGTRTDGKIEAAAVQTQFYGNALGVSVVDGIVYAESDDMFAYALNARTGQLIWRTSPVGNHLMGNPIVKGRFVYLSAGGVGFNFANVVRYRKTGFAVRGMDVSYNGIYALDRKTGHVLWHHGSLGEAMPTPAVHKNVLFFATGSGSVHALDRRTGRSLWTTRLKGNDNMSSPAYSSGRIFLAMAIPPRLYSLDARTGKVLWSRSIRGAANTGMGDVSPAVSRGVVVMDTVTRPERKGKEVTLQPVIVAFDAKTGKVLWEKKMRRGPRPPAFKGGVPMIAGHVVYVGSPVNGDYEARDLFTGKRIWRWSRMSSSRSAPTLVDGRLFIAGEDHVYVLDPETGKELSKRKVGGRMGIISPTIVGGTVYLANSWDWIVAMPLSLWNIRTAQ
ncbi:PQQ-binding-like beta-propeller repeat protein [Leptospirillum ferriphilum]|jgi:outer membrane protein assembly factor BamB|nr:PQQ-binding-like beta-propeller repeat protein [Leptospirillum ferriphilum]